MDWATSEVVSVLAFLLPGFAAVTIFYSLTSHPKPSDFERVVQALAFTIAAQAIASVVVYFLNLGWAESKWPEFEEAVISFSTAIVLALIAVIATNNDLPHRALRWMNITRETSFPSEWYSTFSDYAESYVVLQLKDGRRLYGWPEEWPSSPDQGHFRLAVCEWLEGNTRQPLADTSVILVPVQEVNVVQFVEPHQDEAAGE